MEIVAKEKINQCDQKIEKEIKKLPKKMFEEKVVTPKKEIKPKQTIEKDTVEEKVIQTKKEIKPKQTIEKESDEDKAIPIKQSNQNNKTKISYHNRKRDVVKVIEIDESNMCSNVFDINFDSF